MAADAVPLEILLHLPLLCEDKVQLIFHFQYNKYLFLLIKNNKILKLFFVIK